jgi:prepilin signal peptidase PulO-like enzyme (type II secretory pathway)
MTAALTAIAAAPLFAGAAWTGTAVADRLCAGRAPFDDGPAPVTLHRAWFLALGGCVGLGLALHGEPLAHLTTLLFVVLALAGCAAADLACGILPDVLTLVPLAAVVALAALARDAAPALSAALVAVPFAATALASRGRGMGWGDVKLAALGGALLGARGATLAFVLAALAAYIVARASAGGLRRPLAFGPYLAASIAASLFIVRTI